MSPKPSRRHSALLTELAVRVPWFSGRLACGGSSVQGHIEDDGPLGLAGLTVPLVVRCRRRESVRADRLADPAGEPVCR